MNRFYALLLFCCCWSTVVQASHIVGGEMTYRCLGNNVYEVTMTVYRDCENGQAPFDNPAVVTVYRGTSIYTTLNLFITGSIDTLSASITDPCLVAPPGACIESTTYTTNVSLPPSNVSYTLAYQRCCRNATVVNILSPSTVGATFSVEILPAALNGCNNSPAFQSLPSLFLCLGDTFSFDNSVIDLDGDSVVYELCLPLVGASQFNPVGTSPPPFGSITWRPPYSTNEMFGPLPSFFNLNASTGQVTAFPTSPGTFLVGICAKEYRNGVLFSEIRRDFQYVVGNCVPAVQANFNQFATTCDDYDYQFSNTSIVNNNGGFLWFFDTLGTSTNPQPSFTFPDTGTYPITLIAGTGTPCEDTLMGSIVVQVQALELTITPPQLACPGDTVLLVVESRYDSFATSTNYTWGPFSQILAGQGTDSVLVIATSNQNYFVNGVNNFSCQNTAITAINILAQQSTFDTLRPLCNSSLTVDFQNPFSNNPNITDYFWDFAGLGTSTDVNPTFTFPDTGNYDIVLYVGRTTTTCSDTFFLHLDLELSGFQLDTLPDVIACLGDTLAFSITNGLDAYTSSVSYTWAAAGNIIAGQGTDSILIVPTVATNLRVDLVNSYGCTARATGRITVETVNAVIAGSPSSCDTSLVRQFNSAGVVDNFNNTYDWTFGNFFTSTQFNPIVLFPDTGTYDIKLVTGAGGACADSTTISVRIDLEALELQALQSATICSGDSIGFRAIDAYSGFSSSTQYNWTSTNGGIVAGAGTDSILLVPNQSTTINLIATNNFGCSDTVTANVDVGIVQANFAPQLLSCDTSLSVNFLNTSNTGATPANYTWNFAGLGTSNVINPTFTFPDTGLYQVQLLVVSNNGCTDSISIPVSVQREALDLLPLANVAICSGDSINLQAIDVYAGFSSSTQYTWSSTNGGIISGQGSDNILLAPNQATTVSVIATNNFGCSDTATAVIDVTNVQAAFTSQSPSCDTSLSVSFQNFSTSNVAVVNYTWDFAGLGTSTVLNPTFTFPDTGVYQVQLLVDGGNGCLDSLQVPIQVRLEALELQALTNQIICFGDSINLQAIDVYAGFSSSTQYTWSSTNGGIVSGQGSDNILLAPNQATTVSVIATNNFGCSDTTDALVEVTQIEAAFDSLDLLCNLSLTLPFTNLSTSNLATLNYQWSFDNLGTSTQTNPSFSFPDTGSYTITLIAGVGNACADTTSLSFYLPLEGVDLQLQADTTICAGDSITLLVSDRLAAYSSSIQYTWSSSSPILTGQGTNSIQVAPTGTTTVSVAAINSFGCRDTSSLQIDLVNITANFELDTLPCPTTATVGFVNTSTSNVAGIGYNWTFANLGNSSQTNPIFSFPDTGQYAVQLIAGPNSLCPDTLEQPVAVGIRGLILQALPPASVCQFDNVQFQAVDLLDAYSSSTQYNWTVSNNTFAGQGTAAINLQALQSGQVTLIATNNFGCSDTAQTNLAVRIVEADFDSIDLGCNLNLTVPFQNTSIISPSGTAYAWSFGSIGNSTQENPTYTFADTGSYTITLIADAGLACPDTIERRVQINRQGLALVATGDTVFCAGDTGIVQVVNTYEGFSAFTNYSWEPTNLVLTGQNAATASVFIPADNTPYTVIGENAFGCRDTAVANTTILYPTPVLSIGISPDSIFVGQAAQISATNDPNYTYNWQADSSLSAFDIPNPTARPRESTWYYLEVVNQFGCDAADSVFLKIRQPVCAPPVIFVPNAFSPNGDGRNDVFFVNGNNIVEIDIIIYNRWGQQVFSSNDQNIGWDGRYRGELMLPGVYAYYVRCVCEEGDVYQAKGNITLLR